MFGQHSSGCESGCNDSHDCFDHGSHDYWGGPDSELPKGRGGGGECFPFSVLVSTPSGKIPIGNLSVGQFVLSYADGILVPRRITRKLIYPASPVVEVKFKNIQQTLRCTKNHSFFTETGWQRLGKLHIGSNILRPDFGPCCIEHINQTHAVEPVYNLYTAFEHNFIADGFVAHNFTHLRSLRTMIHRLFFDGESLEEQVLNES